MPAEYVAWLHDFLEINTWRETQDTSVMLEENNEHNTGSMFLSWQQTFIYSCNQWSSLQGLPGQKHSAYQTPGHIDFGGSKTSTRHISTSWHQRDCTSTTVCWKVEFRIRLNLHLIMPMRASSSTYQSDVSFLIRYWAKMSVPFASMPSIFCIATLYVTQW